jgi:biotin carboxylase
MKKIAIIGASYLQKPLVEKALEMGLYTICFAWEEGAVCKDLCHKFYPLSILEKEKILEICKREQISGITSIASDLAVPTVCFVAEKMKLTGNSIISSIGSTNKFIQRNILHNESIKVPKFANAKSLSEDLIAEKLNFPIIIKPVDRSGSKGVVVLKNPENYSDNISYAMKESLCGEVIVEEFINGVEISVETISWEGNHSILAFTDKTTTGYPHFVELEHHQPSKFWKSNLHNLICTTVTKALDVLNINFGASHSELIISTDGEVYITEIGARMGGDFIGSHLVMLSTGYDFLKAVLDVALNNSPASNFFIQKKAGVCFYTAETLWVADFIKSKNQNIVEWDIGILNEKPLTESSIRSGFFVYNGNQKIDYEFYKLLF